jgi:hypothetical protein
MPTELEIALRELAIARTNKQIVANRALEKRAALESSPTYREWAEAAELAKAEDAAVLAADALVRQETLNAYVSTGDKHPMPGAEIKLRKYLNYDSDAAIAWCRTNAPALIETKLSRQFDKVAEKIGAPVEVQYEAQVALATNLNGYLPGDMLLAIAAPNSEDEEE